MVQQGIGTMPLLGVWVSRNERVPIAEAPHLLMHSRHSMGFLRTDLTSPLRWVSRGSVLARGVRRGVQEPLSWALGRGPRGVDCPGPLPPGSTSRSHAQ